MNLPQRAQPGLRPEPRICLTMKSMKDMKKAVAEFRTSYIALLDEVTVLPLVSLTSPFGRRPNLFMFFMLFMVNLLVLFFHEPLDW